jgi:hypothetical protein
MCVNIPEPIEIIIVFMKLQLPTYGFYRCFKPIFPFIAKHIDNKIASKAKFLTASIISNSFLFMKYDPSKAE